MPDPNGRPYLSEKIDGTSITGGATVGSDGNYGIRRAALTGDVTASAGSNVTTIANDAVTFAKMANLATDRIVGRDTASTGDPEALTVGGGLEFTGSGGIQRSALTGDVTAAAGSSTLEIAANAVGNAELRDSGALSVIGRAANSGGDPADISATAGTYAEFGESGSTLAFRRRSFQTLTVTADEATLDASISVNAIVTNTTGGVEIEFTFGSLVSGMRGLIVFVGGGEVGGEIDFTRSDAGTLYHPDMAELLLDSNDIAVFGWGYDGSRVFVWLEEAWFGGSDSWVVDGIAAAYDAVAVTSTIASGTYTPTLSNTTNVGASTAYECQYMRVGSTVTVSGKVDVDPTAAGDTVLGITLPVASNLGTAQDCAGCAFAPGIAGQGAAILADTTNDRATMQWVAVDITNQAMHFTFSYQVI